MENIYLTVKDFALYCWDSYSPFKLVLALLAFISLVIVFPLVLVERFILKWLD